MIPHSRPTLGEEEKRACCEVLDSLQMAQGRKVAEFERAICSFTGRRHAVAVSSGTAALYLSFLALEISRGDEVILPTYSCAALLHPLLSLGGSPVFADSEPADFNLSGDDAAAKIRRRTKAVVVPHLFGRPADMAKFEKLGIPVIEDGTQALGACVGRRKAGSFGLLSVFSFYATKMIATGEGGMILTDSARLAGLLRDLRDYDKKETFRLRTNSKMTEIEAALGLVQLSRLPEFIAKRRALAARYDELLGDAMSLPPNGGGRDHVYFRYVVRAPRAASWIKKLNRRGVDAKSPVFKPLHRYYKMADSRFPVCVKAMKEAVSLPIFPSMTEEELEASAAAMSPSSGKKARGYVEVS